MRTRHWRCSSCWTVVLDVIAINVSTYPAQFSRHLSNINYPHNRVAKPLHFHELNPSMTPPHDLPLVLCPFHQETRATNNALGYHHQLATNPINHHNYECGPQLNNLIMIAHRRATIISS